MSLEDAIRVIQIHERARQGRLRAKFMREIRQQEEREKRAALRGVPTLDPEVASVRIQKVRPYGLLCEIICSNNNNNNNNNWKAMQSYEHTDPRQHHFNPNSNL